MTKNSARPSKQNAPLPVVWLTLDGLKSVPRGATMAVTAFEVLWGLLGRGGCKGVMVDSRYRFPGGDGWEAALRIREAYPVLPLAVLTPASHAPAKPGRNTAFVRQLL